MKRRNFLTSLGISAVGLSFMQSAMASQLASLAGATGRVVVVGGGMAGTTVAKYLRLWGGTGVEVTLVEPNATYYSNIFSNMVLTGERTLSQLAYNYSTISAKYGVKVQNARVTEIDYVGKKVTLSNGSSPLSYDRLILAPGIDFETLDDFSGTIANKSKIVHAWQAGEQTVNLQKQIAAMTKTDTFILAIPPAPYRCPPGPYERACVVADYLKRVKGGSKVIVLDANPKIQAENENFTKAFNEIHKGIITYIPNAPVTAINADTMTITAGASGIPYKGKVINYIPTHKAGKLIVESGIGLANAGKWAAVDVLTYESTNSALKGIHILGDSSATSQPKAGHIANAEAKVCADAILQIFKGGIVNPSPVTNSSCFTPITKTTASWLSVVFKYDGTGKMIPAGNGVTESNGATSENYEDMLKWFNNLMADTFA